MGYNPETGMYTPDKPSTAVVPGSAQDPFYQSTGKMKEVTLPDGRKIQALDVGSTKPPPALEIGKVSAASGLTITGTERNAAKEAEARAIGYTKEYLASRGGINSQGYFNDTPISGQLTAEEQKQVRLPNGNTDTAAMAKILQDKQIAELVSKGMSTADATKQVSAGYGEYGIGGPSSGAAGASGVSGAAGAAASGRTLASDTFTNTFALIFGKAEAAQPYVKQLYSIVSGFYKTGSTIEESLNLAIRQARQDKAIPEFTKRFKGIFDLEDKFNAGMAVEVPTIAEFFAAESKMGELLNQAGLNDLATQEFLGNVIGQGKSVATVANLISDAFNTIDTAPTALRETLNTYFPNVDRTSLAKAILTGEQGAKALSDKIKGISVLSAAGSQGVSGIGLDYAQNLANMGIDYQEALTGFAQVKNLERGDTLAQFGGGTFSSAQAQKAVFEKSVEEQNKIDVLRELERGRFLGDAGTTKSSLTSGTLGQI
jgi:ethanolamine utilization microcompartment shell protein EutL